MRKNDAVEMNTSVGDDKLLDLRVLVKELWRWKWILVIAAIIGAIIGVRNVSSFVPTYVAKMIVQPVDSSGGDVPTRMGGGGILGVARSIGFATGGASNASFDLFRVMIGSTLLAVKIQNKHGLMQRVYESSWDNEKKDWIKPKVDENTYKQQLRRFLHLNSWHPPSIESLAGYLSGMVKIEQVGETVFYKISVEHSDRDFALYLLDIVYREADDLIGRLRRQEQEERKEYLERQIEKARLVEVRDALLSLLMQQEQRAIIADAKPPYTIKVIEPLHAPAAAKEPALRRAILVPVVVMVALVIVVVTIVVSFRTE